MASPDKHAAKELELYMLTDGMMYEVRLKPTIAYLEKRVANGTFDAAKSVKLWLYAVDEAAKRYAKEYGGKWHENFSKPTRLLVATRRAINFMLDNGIPVSAHDQKVTELDHD